MSTDAGTRPCPYCGELIKNNAIKCRFCGEFLDEQRAPPALPMAQVDEPSTGVKMIVPVGRSGWSIASGWLGVISVVPFPIFVFTLMSEAGQTMLTRSMYLAAGINTMFGFLAIVTAIGAFVSKKPGKFRAVFGVTAGLIGIIGYWTLVLCWDQVAIAFRNALAG